MELSDPLIAPLRQSLCRALEGARPGRVLLAVSGGLDSMLLLELATAARGAQEDALAVVHVDHGLRGAASDADRDLVVARCAALDVPCRVVRVRTLAPDAPSLEARAREARMEAFREAARALGAGEVWTAHHLDDQLETLVARVLRRAGPRGLRGIPGRRQLCPGTDLVRPWLPHPRRQLAAVATAVGLAWREDDTNTDERHQRNRIRHALLPRLRDREPACEALLTELSSRSAALLRARDAAIDSIADTLHPLGAGLVHLRPLPSPAQADPDLLRALLEGAFVELGLPAPSRFVTEQVEAVWAREPASRRSIDVEGPVTITPRAHGLDLHRDQETTGALALKDAALWDPIALTFSVALQREGEAPTTRLDPRHATWLAPDAIRGKLRIRTAVRGERFRGLGSPGSRRLGRALADRGLPAHVRARWPVIADDAGPLWSPGLPPAERAALANASDPRLLVEVAGRGIELLDRGAAGADQR